MIFPSNVSWSSTGMYHGITISWKSIDLIHENKAKSFFPCSSTMPTSLEFRVIKLDCLIETFFRKLSTIMAKENWQMSWKSFLFKKIKFDLAHHVFILLFIWRICRSGGRCIFVFLCKFRWAELFPKVRAYTSNFYL